ncbi:MAG: SGNH/GDSL hydrolase family protein, partial [Myxococcales bacterium]|nr:SGNH/GDSL hydrolase family protein [Myxococcales bacterium]
MTAVGLARKLGIAALVGAYSLVFGEVFLRVMAPQAILPRFVTGTPLGIRGNIPGARYRQWTPETEVEIRINAQGLRADREFARAKPSGTCRVALLGDSYLLGFENDLPDSIAGRLQARFDASPWRVEVLDFAVSGFGTAEMLVQFDGEVAAFAPDVTVFQFHASDLRDNVRTARLFEEDARTGALRRTDATYLPGVAVQDRLMHFAAYRWAIEHSHLYTAVRERAALLGKDLLFALGRRDARDDAEDGDGASEAGEVGGEAGGGAAGA